MKPFQITAGCTLPLALLFGGAVYIGMTLADVRSPAERLGIAVLAAGAALIGGSYLLVQETLERWVALRRVRRRLAECRNVSDEQFLASFPVGDRTQGAIDSATLILEIRRALAEYFSVPPTKIHADSSLDDIYYDVFQDSLPGLLLPRVADELRLPAPDIQQFDKGQLASIADFVCAAKDVLNPDSTPHGTSGKSRPDALP